MPEISPKTLVMAIQTVDIEIARLRACPDDPLVPEDQLFLEDLEQAADELAQAYALAQRLYSNLPVYSQLVKTR